MFYFLETSFRPRSRMMSLRILSFISAPGCRGMVCVFGFARDSQAKVSGSVGDLNASRLKPPKKFTLLHDLLYWLNT